MIGINFDRDKAERILQSLNSGKPIELLSPEGWTGHDMLALAGACFFGAMSQGPGMYQLSRGVDFNKMPTERREAVQETFANYLHDLRAAVEYYCHLTMLVADGVYDARGYEPRCRGAVITKDGKWTFILGEGMPKS